MNDLPDRSRRAVDREAEVIKLSDGLFLLQSGNSGEWYNVDLNEMTCECPDHEYRGEICWHQRKCAIADAKGEVQEV